MKKQVQLMFLSDAQVTSILKRVDLEWGESQSLRKRLKKKKIQRLSLRDKLCEENMESSTSFYLVEGIVNLLVTLQTGQKAILTQINQEEFLNLEIAFNDGKSKYSIIAASPFICYIELDEKDSLTLAYQLRSQLFDAMSFREQEKMKKQKKGQEELRKKRIQKQIDKLKLPIISMADPVKNQNIINQPNGRKPEMKSTQLSLGFSKALKNMSKSASLRKLSSQSKPESHENLQSEHLSAVSNRLLQNYKQFQDKVVSKKLLHLKSQRSMSLVQKQPQKINYSRNEHLFKQHLKYIVKRKLMFERKHFKILKRLNNRDIDNQIHIQEDVGGTERYGGNQMNPIDNYFDL